MTASDLRPPYALITPARNEAVNLRRLIDCVVSQTHPPVRWVVVDDGSEDGTNAIAREWAERVAWMEVVEMPPHRDRSFAAKAQCFNTGYARLGGVACEVVGNLDADVSFDADYFEFLMRQFAADASLGVAGTVFREPGGYSSETGSFEGQVHVAGGVQMFRRRCLEEVGGYVPNPAGGVDWIAVTTARMKGWKTRAFRDRFFFHHRKLGTAERGVLRSAFSYGEKDYYLGNAPVWQLFRVGYQLARPPYLAAGSALALGYVSAALRGIPRAVSPELMRFHRAEQKAKLKAILASLAHLKGVDKFQLTPR
jgi:glycosyltransferase involved in cell wall biosynthesis